MKNDQNHDCGNRKTCGATYLTLAAGAVAALFGAAPVLAEPLFQNSIMPRPDNSRWTDNYVEIGAGGVQTNSPNGKAFKFGEFTGLEKDDPFAIVGFNWIFNNRSNDAIYLRTHASDLALDTRKLSVEGGRQGSWDLSFSAESLLRAEVGEGKFVHNGLGTSALTNPANGTDVALAANLKNFDIEQARDIYRLGARGVLGANWDYKISYREDQRDGTRLTGVALNTGARQAAIVPYEINDKTQQIDATLGYVSKNIEGQLTYSYSRYENSLDRFTMQNPNSNANPTAQLSLMPDNEYHQITATSAYNFTRNTRAKAQLSYGVALQNEAFLPYNIAGAGITSGTLLPAASLDAKVINTVADLAFLTRPTEAMNLKLGYQFRDVDNETARNRYLYAGRDGAQGTANGANDRITAPVSTREQKLLVDADYEIAARTQLRALVEHTMTDYTLSDVSETKTNKAALDLRRYFSEEFTGNLGYIFTQRTGSSYDKNTYFRETYTPTFQGTAAGILTNHPSVRSFIYNDYDENRGRASGNWVATETVTAGASFDIHDRKYKGNNCNQSSVTTLNPLTDTCLGTRQARGGNANFDLQWQPDEELLTFAFLTLGLTETDIDQRNWTAKTSAGLSSTATSDWHGKLTYTDHTIGFGAKWQYTPKLELGGQYVFALGEGRTDITPSTAVMPDLESKLHNLNIYAKWAYSNRLTFRFNYLYERLATKDWAYDNFDALSNNQLLMTGQTAANYDNHVVGVSVAISTW